MIHYKFYTNYSVSCMYIGISGTPLDYANAVFSIVRSNIFFSRSSQRSSNLVVSSVDGTWNVENIYHFMISFIISINCSIDKHVRWPGFEIRLQLTR